jgi:hypothetical protein
VTSIEGLLGSVSRCMETIVRSANHRSRACGRTDGEFVVPGATVFACADYSASRMVEIVVFDGKTTQVKPPLEISEKLGAATGVTFSVWLRRNSNGFNRRNEIMSLTIEDVRAKAVIGFLADNTIRIGGRTRPDEQLRSAATVSAWTDNSLLHIVGVLDLQVPGARIYVNGQLQDLQTEIDRWEATSFPIQSGKRNSIGAGADLKNHFQGEIGDIRVYARALDEEEIGRLHVLERNVGDEEIASLIFHWAGEGQVLEEASGVVRQTEQATPEIPRITEVGMVRIAGSPQQIGRIRGKYEGESIQKTVEAFLATTQREQVPMQTLEFYAQPGIERVGQIAPHWLEEMSVMAETAGVAPDLYLTYMYSNLIFSSRGKGWRELCTEFPHECTSYAATGPVTENHGIFWHKTRDNVPSTQSAYIVTSDIPGIYKFVQIATMAVNEKGLVSSGDWGGPEPTVPRYRGRINFTRHIMEKAADCDEALAILQDVVGRGWYVGGTRVGQRWTIVDRRGRILDVTHSSDVDSLKWQYVDNGGPHITRESAQRLLEVERPLPFLTFHDVSRDTLVKSSIAGCTVEVHPEYPEYLTIVWASFPARSLPFALFTGGTKTPVPLLDGTVDAMGNRARMSFEGIRELERSLYRECKNLQQRLYSLIEKEREKEVPDIIDAWVQDHTKRQAEALYFAQ